jgi:hypothetical protein
MTIELEKNQSQWPLESDGRLLLHLKELIGLVDRHSELVHKTVLAVLSTMSVEVLIN